MITERGLLMTTTVMVALVRTALWVLPSWASLAMLRTLATAPPRRRRGGRPPIGRLASAVVVASRSVPHATCLTQAVAAQLLLLYFGYGSTLEVGVARNVDGDFVAHAWIEQDGRVVIGGDNTHSFTRLRAFGRGNARGTLDG